MSRIGDAYAEKIIANRPCEKDELISKNMIRKGTTIAKQPAERR